MAKGYVSDMGIREPTRRCNRSEDRCKETLYDGRQKAWVVKQHTLSISHSWRFRKVAPLLAVLSRWSSNQTLENET
jgi:hypothetical protein